VEDYFEGTPDNMFASLNKFKNLPEETLVFCAHEYTESNLKFALAINPNNKDLIEYSKELIS
jgi:hydroxyacylglutathione hydrolase